LFQTRGLGGTGHQDGLDYTGIEGVIVSIVIVQQIGLCHILEQGDTASHDRRRETRAVHVEKIQVGGRRLVHDVWLRCSDGSAVAEIRSQNHALAGCRDVHRGPHACQRDSGFRIVKVSGSA